MKVFIRGHAEPVEADQPVPPRSPFSLVVADTPVTSAHSITRGDSTSAPGTLTAFDAVSPAPATVSFAPMDAPVLFGPVASAVTEIQVPAVMRGDLGGSNDTGGDGDIARGSDTLASLSLDGPAYADHGWFIVPSAANEYGEGYAATDDFAFDVAAGEFSADWFWV